MKDDNNLALILGAGVVIGGLLFWLLHDEKEPDKESHEKPKDDYVDDLKMIDIVHYFKELHLDKDSDTPFLTNNEGFKQFASFPENHFVKIGYTTIILGVFSNDDKVKDFHVIFTRHCDDEITNLLKSSKDNLVILK